MAHTKKSIAGNVNNGSVNTFSYSGSFDVFKASEVEVELDNVALTFTTSTINESASPREYTVDFTNKTVHIGGADLTSTDQVVIQPVTDMGSPTPRATYTAGASVTSADLNNNQLQLLRKAMEYDEQKLSSRGGTMTGNLHMGEDVNISFEGATDNNFETTITVADPTSDKTITFPDTTGTVVTTGDTGTVATGMIAGDAITGAKIADDQINSEHYVDGSIDTAHIGSAQVNADKLASDSVITAKIQNLAVTTGKIADDAVTAAKLAHTSVTAGSYTATDLTVDDQGRITAAASGTIAGSEIAADAIDGTKIADDSINSEHYVDGSIDTAHIADAQVTQPKLSANAVATANIADNQVSTAKLIDSSVTTAKINADAVTNAKIADDSIDSEHYVDGSIDTAHIAGAQVTDAKLASNSVVTSKITDANVTTVKIADSNVTLGKLASDLKQTTISDSDTQLPTSGAVVDYVAAQLLPFGGFEAVATEVAFPNTQPASGVIISISDAAGVVVSGSGVSTTGRTVGGSTVTINNFPSSLNGETLASGVGLMVSSTGSSQIYNYHKILAAETDVKQLSDDINDFNARYRVGSSNPTSALDGGDLFFNTGSSKLLVYNNTSSAWEEAQSIGQYFINTISSYSGTGGNSASFNGAAYRFILSNPGTVAEQHIVSINGVIQKPNSGTSQPSEGFAIDGSSIIFSSAPASSADFFIITIGSTVNIGTPSDGTVSTSKLASGAVTTAKIADDAVTAAKLASDAVVTASIVDDAVTADKIANSVNSAIAANTAKTSNATHTGEVTGGTALTIADNVVDEANLKVSNSPTNGYLLSAQSGNTGGLTWVASPASDVVDDTSPQLGGDLQTNGNNIDFGDSGGGSDDRAVFGADTDMQLYHTGSQGVLDNDTGALDINTTSDLRLNVQSIFKVLTKGGTEDSIKATTDGAVELYHNNIKVFETNSAGFATASDSKKVQAGASDEIRMYHDGSNSYFDQNGSGATLYVYNHTADRGITFGTEGTNRFQLSDNGHLIPASNNTYDIGTSSYRWRNIYTNDLNLSNEGHSNDVDGTWGDWTIQEGESDLFLKNNRSGKKYKFNLTEVS